MRLIVFFLLALFTASCARHSPSTDIVNLTPPVIPQTKAKMIIIDAGHGGKDPGANSTKDVYQEKNLTLTTAKQVRNFLQELGYDAILTRTQDIYLPLQTRTEIANAVRADLFVSIHYNYSHNSEAKGIEVYYYKEQPPSSRVLQSKLLGEAVLDRIVNHTGAASRGVKEANYAVTRETLMPAILIEAGFLSNPAERQKLQDASYLRYLSWGIASGIDKFIRAQQK